MKKTIYALLVVSLIHTHVLSNIEHGRYKASFGKQATTYFIAAFITVSSSNPIAMVIGGTALIGKGLYDIFKNHKEPQQKEPTSLPGIEIPDLPHLTRINQTEAPDNQGYNEPIYVITKTTEKSTQQIANNSPNLPAKPYCIDDAQERISKMWQTIEPEVSALQNEYNDMLELYQKMDDEPDIQRYQNRLSALQKTQDHPDYVLQKNYSLHQLTTDYLVLHAIDTTRFTQLQGNLFQHQIQQELIDIVEQTREIHNQPCITKHMEGMPELMVDFASTAVEYNHAYNPIRAAEIADFCYTTINYGRAIIKGIGLGTANPILFAKEHPYQAAAFGALWLLGVGEVIGALQLGIIAGAAWYPVGVRALECAGTEIGKRHWKYINQTITSMLDAFSEQTTEEQITQTTALATDLLIGYKVRGALGKFFRNALNKIKLFPPKQLVTATGDVTVDIATEFCSVARSGPSNWKDKASHVKEKLKNLYKQPIKPGASNTIHPPKSNTSDTIVPAKQSTNAIQQAREQKKLLIKQKKARAAERKKERIAKIAEKAEQKAAQLAATQCSKHNYEGARNMFKEKAKLNHKYINERYNDLELKDIDLAHDFEVGWNLQRNEPTGYHSARYHPEFIKEITIAANKHGIYEAVVEVNGKTKFSTCFPNDWDEYFLIDVIFDVLKNGKIDKSKKSILAIVGTIFNDLEIEILIENGIIRSVYPLIHRN